MQGNVWLINAGFVNVAAQIGDDGVLVVDTGTAALGEKILAEIRRLAGDKTIRFIINTHAHPDHTGGNPTIAKAGRSIISGNFAGQAGQDAANAAKIVAHENTLRRLSEGEGSQQAAPSAAWPTDTFFVRRNDLRELGVALETENHHQRLRKLGMCLLGGIHRARVELEVATSEPHVTTEQAQKLTLAATVGTLSLALRDVSNVDLARIKPVTLKDLGIMEAIGTVEPDPNDKPEKPVVKITRKPKGDNLPAIGITRGTARQGLARTSRRDPWWQTPWHPPFARSMPAVVQRVRLIGPRRPERLSLFAQRNRETFFDGERRVDLLDRLGDVGRHPQPLAARHFVHMVI